jgi:hypothetical protein
MRKELLQLVSVLPYLALVLLVAGLTYATFPGQNGRISFARFFPETNSHSIFSICPGGADERQLTFDAVKSREGVYT